MLKITTTNKRRKKDSPFYTGMKGLSIFLVFTLFFCSCQSKNDETEKITALIRRLNEADNKADIPKILSVYADTIVFVPPGKPAIRGKKNVADNYSTLFADHRLEITISITTVDVAKNKAIVTGFVTGLRRSLNSQSISPIDDQYAMVLSRASDRNWLISRLVWWPAVK